MIIWSHSRVLRADSASDLSNMAFPCCLDFYALLGAQTSLRFHACGPSQRDFCERFAMNVLLYLDALYIWVYCKVQLCFNHYCRSVFRDQVLGMVRTKMVTLVSSADIPGLRTSIKYVGRSFIQMKRKGSIIVPCSRGTSQLRESSRRIGAWLLRYNLGKNFLGQVVYRPPPPPPFSPYHPAKNCPYAYVYSAKAAVPV